MKILLVTDQFLSANNGMTVSGRRFAKVLMEHGNEVRVVCTGKEEDVPEGMKAYLMRKQYIPGFDKLITSQGMTFAHTDLRLLMEAIEWADVVHFLVPFTLSRHGVKMCMEMGVPYTAAFHVQPENISSSLHMGKVRFVNAFIYWWLRWYFFKYCDHIHCPSRFIAEQMREHGYEGNLYVISNGIDPDFTYRKIEKTPEFAGKFVILMVGRYSIEKRQDIIIDAAKKSKYADRIQIVLAGKGPREKKLRERANGLANPIVMRFFTKPELLDMIAMSDLYVHCSDFEIEAMSCMEAFAGGLVPVISNSAKSATPQFALDDRSLFNAGDSGDLAKKIDYWIEHPAEKADMELQYAEYAKKFNLDRCVLRAEEMFNDAIDEVECADGERSFEAHRLGW